MHRLLQNAIILDTETTGLARGSGIHEMAVLDLQTQRAYEWILDPNLIRVRGQTKQDVANLASAQTDQYKRIGVVGWLDVARKQLEGTLGRSVQDHELPSLLRRHNSFLGNALFGSQPYPHLVGKTESPRDLLRNAGVNLTRMSETTPEQVFGTGSSFENLIRGKTIWIANAPFESKQIGAQIGAMEADGLSSNLKGLMETQNLNSPDPFYVTGAETNQARVAAQLSGDWTGVWKAMVANPPKAGETAVRDIQDVTRALMGYGRKLGLIDTKDQYFGQSIDTQYRLLGSLEGGDQGKEFLRTKELHRAAEDAAVHEQYVLRKAIHYTAALEQVHEGTAEGLRISELAKQGQGPLHEAGLYFARMEAAAPQMKRAALAQRFGRALEDLEKDAVTYQVAGIDKVIGSNQTTPSGGTVQVPRTLAHRIELSSLDDLVGHLERDSSYGEFGVDVRAEYDRFRGAASQGSQEAADFVEQERAKVGEFFDQNTDKLMGIQNPRRAAVAGFAPREAAGAVLGGVAEALDGVSLGKQFAMGALGVSALGMMFAGRNPSQERPRSFTSYNYQDWYARQGEFYGQAPYHSGMQESGIAGMQRKSQSDFGSPYQGPLTSSMVLHDQELLRERERYLQMKYGVEHFDPIRGLFANLKPRGGYRFLQGGERVDGSQYGLQGNLLGINLSDGKWKVEVDDADTLAVKRGGLKGAVMSLFGQNHSYSFRLAGIDSPETAHGDGSYHAPQPRAEESAVAFQAMLDSSKDLSLIYDPNQTTYGRMMGAVIGDGRNLNFDLVRRGTAAHLAFGKSQDSMIDYGVMGSMESQAFRSNRGMWQTPWAQTYHAVTEASGDRITFNTFTRKERLVGSASQMSTLGLMEHAEATGMVSTAHLTAAAELGGALKAQRFAKDYDRPHIFRTVNAPHGAFQDQLIMDAGLFMRTKGTGENPNRYSARGHYGRLDSRLALDTMQGGGSVMNKSPPRSLEQYDAKNQARKQRQQQAQRNLNQTVFNSGIGHHQM